MEKMRVPLMLDVELVKQLDELATEMGVSRNAYFNVMIRAYLQGTKVLKVYDEILEERKRQRQIDKTTTTPQP